MLCICRKNRNMYSQLMLHMLKRGSLEGPFTQRPEEGPLSTLPAYMVNVSFKSNTACIYGKCFLFVHVSMQMCMNTTPPHGISMTGGGDHAIPHFQTGCY